MAEAGVVTVDAKDGAVVHLVELALILTLFSDGMLVERELLARHWAPVARAIVIAMPITLALLALAAKGLFPSLELGRGLPARPPCSPRPTRWSRPRSSPPRTSRPASVTRSTSSRASTTGWRCRSSSSSLSSPRPGATPAPRRRKLLGEAAFGALVGVVVGMVGGRLHHHLPGGGLTSRYEGIYAIGFALLAFGLADVTIGNGLIAAFVAGIAMGAAERDVPEAFVEFSENVSAIFQVITFFVFGALIVATGYDRDVPALIAFIFFALLIARPVAVLLSFLRERMPRSAEAVHRLVRAQGGRLDAVRAARAQLRRRRARA